MNTTIDRASGVPVYLQLYRQLKNDIVSGVYPEGAKLPSKRLIASELGISVISVEHAMELLADEGFTETRERSGYFVIYREQDGFSMEDAGGYGKMKKTFPREGSAKGTENLPDPGSADAAALFCGQGSPVDAESSPDFPFSVYAKTMRRVISEYGEALLVKSPNKGVLPLRSAICAYLARNRGISVSEDQVIIGSGAEYLYGILVQILGRSLVYGIEQPSYEKIEQVYLASEVSVDRLALGPDGIMSSELRRTDPDVLHISPYRSYPSGVTASASKRREYIRWADAKDGRWIIEDDFESEFTPSTKPEDTLFALADRGNVIYLNTFSKTVAPSIRTGYMVLPERLLERAEQKAGFYSCAVPTFEQYVLAEFISNGDFERHINRVRRQNRKSR